MKGHRGILIAVLLISLVAYFLLGFFTLRTGAVNVVTLYLVAFAMYFIACRTGNSTRELNLLLSAALAFRLILLFAVPELSDDFYRFLWDGELMKSGTNPYLHLPSDLPLELLNGDSAVLLSNMNSQEYYSVYPPLLQYFFLLASVVSGGDTYISIIFLKLLILLAEAGSVFFLLRLGRSFELGNGPAMLYMLNPLVIMELCGSLHFDAFLIFGMLGSLFFAGRNRIIAAGLFAGFAAAAKLLPVVLLPFFARRLGWKRTLVFLFVAGIVVAATFLPLFSQDAASHFAISLRLYFRVFEFNASIYYLGIFAFGREHAEILGNLLPVLTGILIAGIAIREKGDRWKSLPVLMMAAFCVYHLLSPVVHPWYITSIVAFACLTRYRFVLVWSALLPFTYLTYSQFPYQENYMAIWIEYAAVMGYLAAELLNPGGKRTIGDAIHSSGWFRKIYRATIPMRLKIKSGKILPLLRPGEKILDIGAGNCGLTAMITGSGMNIIPIDVKDRSFFESVRPQIFDGIKLPFPDHSFDTALLITVLHHSHDPDQLLQEALRVSKRVVIMEDIFRNPVQMRLTKFADSLANLEFAGHPHNNRDDNSWRKTFDGLNATVVYQEEFRTLLFFRQVVYVVEGK